MARPEKARIIGEGRRNGLTPDDIPDGFLSWEEHVLAWEEYNRRKRSEQTAEEIEAMGGFSYRQVSDLLGHPPVTWELQEPLRYAQFALAAADQPIDLTQAVPVEEVPKLTSHIRHADETRICQEPGGVPEGMFFFDAAEGPFCQRCFGKMQAWLNWAVDSGRSDG